MAGKWQKKKLNCPGLQVSIRNGVKVIKEMMQENPATCLLTVIRYLVSFAIYLCEHISEVLKVRMVESGELVKSINDRLWNVFHALNAR